MVLMTPEGMTLKLNAEYRNSLVTSFRKITWIHREWEEVGRSRVASGSSTFDRILLSISNARHVNAGPPSPVTLPPSPSLQGALLWLLQVGRHGGLPPWVALEERNSTV